MPSLSGTHTSRELSIRVRRRVFPSRYLYFVYIDSLQVSPRSCGFRSMYDLWPQILLWNISKHHWQTRLYSKPRLWISLVVTNVEGFTAYCGAYHSRWTQDTYELSPRFALRMTWPRFLTPCTREICTLWLLTISDPSTNLLPLSLSTPSLSPVTSIPCI